MIRHGLFALALLLSFAVADFARRRLNQRFR